ncbi:metallo-beta-lactamase superfamily protein [Trichoderma chlorosporum]
MHLQTLVVPAVLLGGQALACSDGHDHGHEALRARASNQNAASLVNKAIQALGGRNVLEGLTGITYESSIYRTNTLAENYHLFQIDNYVDIRASNNISFTWDKDNTLYQRIDRAYQRSYYFFFAQPTAAPGSFSLTMKDGPTGYACYVNGNYNFFDDVTETSGYTDGIIAAYLLYEARKANPKLLLEVEKHQISSQVVEYHDVQHQAVLDETMNILIIFDNASGLPYIIRSFENHDIYGPTTNDLLLFDYASVNGFMYPQRQLQFYNATSIVADGTYPAAQVNPTFAADFFDGLPLSQTTTTPAPPKSQPGYGHAELGEYWRNSLWGGPYTGTLANLTYTNVTNDLPNLHLLKFTDYPIIEHLVLEFDDGTTIVFEAPPHQTDLVIEYVTKTRNRKITHLWPSHHHHDHNYEVKQYVALGAKIIVPEVAAPYWNQIPNAQLVTYNDKNPFIHSDGKMQVRFMWRPEAAHSEDWSYAMITSSCPSADSSMVLYEGDAWSNVIITFPDLVALQWLDQIRGDGVGQNAIVVPAHGQPTLLADIIKGLGYVYPPYDSRSFTTGGNICVNY